MNETKYNSHDLTSMRRKDRAVEDESWIGEFLSGVPEGILATARDGQPFFNINTFVYDPDTHSIYLHTAGHGRLRDNIVANEKVSFCASRMGRLLPADTAREFSVEYESVIAFGRCTLIADIEFARTKMQMLMNKYFGHLKPGTDYRPITDTELQEISCYRIKIDSWSGKRKFESPDFPGVFRFRKPPA